jgi:DNA-binding transcriptional ArsR family regulator
MSRCVSYGREGCVKVKVGAGTGIEWLVAAVAVADPDWRTVFAHGQEAYDAALAAGGRPLVRDAAKGGRSGWIRLLGPLTRRGGAWSVEALRALLADEPDRLRVLDLLPAPTAGPPALTHIRRRLREVGPEQLVAEVAPGIHYGPGVLDDVVLVSSRQVAPIIVEHGDGDRTVIVHPPLGEQGATDAGARLRELGRALGDVTRMRVLQQLRTRERNLPELCEALETPRTTLLHHLALLRGAGLIDLTVAAGEPNLYRLREEGFAELGSSARAFVVR